MAQSCTIASDMSSDEWQPGEKWPLNGWPCLAGRSNTRAGARHLIDSEVIFVSLVLADAQGKPSHKINNATKQAPHFLSVHSPQYFLTLHSTPRACGRIVGSTATVRCCPYIPFLFSSCSFPSFFFPVARVPGLQTPDPRAWLFGRDSAGTHFHFSTYRGSRARAPRAAGASPLPINSKHRPKDSI